MEEDDDCLDILNNSRYKPFCIWQSISLAWCSVPGGIHFQIFCLSLWINAANIQVILKLTINMSVFLSSPSWGLWQSFYLLNLWACTFPISLGVTSVTLTGLSTVGLSVLVFKSYLSHLHLLISFRHGIYLHSSQCSRWYTKFALTIVPSREGW
jgi:hypothetical protein